MIEDILTKRYIRCVFAKRKRIIYELNSIFVPIRIIFLGGGIGDIKKLNFMIYRRFIFYHRFRKIFQVSFHFV